MGKGGVDFGSFRMTYKFLCEGVFNGMGMRLNVTGQGSGWRGRRMKNFLWGGFFGDGVKWV